MRIKYNGDVILMNYIWSGMIILSLIVGIANGRIGDVAAAAAEGSAAALDVCLSLLGIMCLWTGIAKIGEKAGIIKKVSKILQPALRWLFPDLKDEKAKEGIVMNIAANLFGMGNAATPLGIKAMEELKRAGGVQDAATNAMCMFAVLNTASLQLIPTTLISLRQAYGSADPGIIIVPVWLAGLCALTAGIAAEKFFERKRNL